MQFNNYILRKIPLLTFFSLSIVLTSCGSYQYTGQDNDGIYNSDSNTVEYEREVTQTSNNGGFYENYFKEKSLEYEMPEEEGDVFTDVDSYEGNYATENSNEPEYTTGYAGWGNNTEDVTVNVYNSGFNNFGWYNPYRAGFGWGYSPYWNIGWDYYGYSPFFYGGYYGAYYPYHWYGYGYGYHNYNYYAPYAYSRRGIVYQPGRRGNLYSRGTIARQYDTNTRNTRTVRRSSILNNTRRTYNNSTRVRSSNNTSRSIRTTPRTRSNTNSVRTRTTTPRVRTRTTTPQVRTRSSAPRRSSTINSAPSRTRSSGSMSRGGRRGGR
ncbi:hypothetical protein [Corallibacter sp.]|uniref:hypothetical protein n=1 Tax=Corallibacter sp. TaxID=2038084 RepID=UPI003AB21407